MTDQKPNCNNCNIDCGLNREYSCLSHPDAKAWLMRGVVTELERLSEIQNHTALNECESTERFTYQMVALEKANILETAISLIKDG